MKRTMNILTSLIAVTFIAVLMMSFSQPEHNRKPWDVPAEYKSMKNPLAAGAQVDLGKNLYMRNCASCHGKAGKGDGPKARSLREWTGDFSMDYFKNQTDGETFYQTKIGRGDMPSYKGKLSDDDIWALVNYLKTL